MNIYQEQPPVAKTEKQLSGYLTSIHLEPRQLTEQEREENDIVDMTDEEGQTIRMEAWTSTDIFYYHKAPLTEDDYPHLVSAIIRRKYSADDVEAIQLNYTDTQSQEHIDEMAALQAWRTLAKTAARTALGNGSVSSQ